MTVNGLIQFFLYIVLILLSVKPLGLYIASVYQGKSLWIDFLVRPLEKLIYYISGILPKEQMDWKKYASSFLLFNLISILIVYFLQRLQAFLPLNPEHFSNIPPGLSFNTAVSFATNTNWQAYGGEFTLSYFIQMVSLTVQNFLSAAGGMAVFIAFCRALAKNETAWLGNFWVDMIKSILYVFLPLSFIFALVLTSLGVIQNFKPYEKIDLIQPIPLENTVIQNQIIAMGPVASQIAIKQLGTNGGGFFNVNASHPFENPTPLSNFLELFAILLIPAALCYTYGVMVNDRRQGWAIFVAMIILFLPLTLLTIHFENAGNPLLSKFNIEQTLQENLSPGGNMEGKETRFGIVNSSIWAAATTTTSNGSVNSMHDSYTPLGGFMLILFMHLSEGTFGGVGSGLYHMLMIIIITVFIGGLMVGRTPEYLGKKIDPFEMKIASIGVLVIPLIVLVFSALALIVKNGREAILNPGSHGLTEVLYAFTSMANNNGSAFAGLNTNNFFYNTLGGIAILIGRYWTAIAALAIAGSLVRKQMVPVTQGTLETHTPIFIGLIVGVVIVIGPLSFFPALALGPIVEHLILWGGHGN